MPGKDFMKFGEVFHLGTENKLDFEDDLRNLQFCTPVILLS